MAAIIAVTDLPTKMQSADMVTDMVAGANASASRVAPCLVSPTATWAATAAYAVGAKVKLSSGEALKATVAGTSGATEPTAPDLGDTVADETVTWERVAPTADQLAEAKLVLLGAVKRWIEAGAGAFQSQTAGPFGVSMDTRQRTGFNLWPSEIGLLEAICTAGSESSGAFSITPTPSSSGHAPYCNLMFGGAYCSCGANLTGYEYPLYEAD